MPAAPRELSVVYGTTTVGGSDTSNLLHMPIIVDEGPDKGLVSFPFVFRAATEALFDSGTASLETAFRTPRLRLRILQGSATLWDFDPTAGTAFNHIPRIDKAGSDEFDSGRSRLYQVTIEFDLPAGVYGQDGRRNARVIVGFSPARRRTLTITGEWTAIGTTSARAQYEANSDVYEASIQTALGGTWERVSEERNEDEENKILIFRLESEELIFNQTSGTLDDPDIVKEDFRISVIRRRPGDSPGNQPVRRLREIRVTYDCWIDRENTTDLAGKYDSTIRPFLLEEAKRVAASRFAGVITEDRNFDGPDNRISAVIDLLVDDGGILLEFRRTTDIQEQSGKVLVPIWTGDPLARYVYQGPSRFIRTITEVRRELGVVIGRRRPSFGVGLQEGAVGTLGLLGGGGGTVGIGVGDLAGARIVGGGRGGGFGIGVGVSAPEGEFIPISTRTTTTPLRLGDEADGLDVTDTTVVTVHELARLVRAISTPVGRQPIRAGGL